MPNSCKKISKDGVSLGIVLNNNLKNLSSILFEKYYELNGTHEDVSFSLKSS